MNNMYAIFASLSANAPLLKNWGMGLSRNLFLTTSDVQGISEITEKLSEHPLLIDPSTPLRQLKEKMGITNSEAVVVVMPHQKLRDCKKFQLLVETVLNWNLHTKCRCQTFFIGSIVPDDMHDLVYEIPISEFLDGTDFNVDVVPEPLDLNVVKEQLCSFQECDHDRLALYAAVACIYPALKRKGQLENYEKLLRTCDQMFDSWMCPVDTSSVVSSARCIIFEAVRSGKYKNDLHFNQNKELLYMPSEIFKQLLAPILKLLPYRKAKEILASEGLLQAGPGLYLTEKVVIDTEQGQVRKNMVALNTKKIVKFVDNEEIRLFDYFG